MRSTGLSWGAVAGPVQHPHPRVGCQPCLDDLGGVDDDVVADHRHYRRRRVGGQQLLAERGEVGADRLAADLVEESAAVQVDGAEDGPPLVAAGVMTRWRVPRATQVARTHRSSWRWVSSSASTTTPSGSWLSCWRSAARTWSRSGSPVATSRGRRQAATSRTRRCRVCRLMAGRPRYRCSSGMVQARGWARSRRIRSPSRGLPSRGRPGRGRSARLWAPWVL
jgi:hypothetical protein